MKTIKIEVPIDAEIIIDGKPYSKHKKYYEELPEGIKFQCNRLVFGNNQMIFLDSISKKYNIVCSHIKDYKKDDKVMIPSDGSDIKIGNWFMQTNKKGSKIFYPCLKIREYVALRIIESYNTELPVSFIFEKNKTSYKIIDRKEAEKLGYIKK